MSTMSLDRVEIISIDFSLSYVIGTRCYFWAFASFV